MRTGDVVSSISAEEVREQLKTMARKMAADTSGVVVELIKAGSNALIETIAAVFSDVLDPKGDAPTVWKETRLKVLIKKGDARIAILPLLY